jgi:hypothetical protein
MGKGYSSKKSTLPQDSRIFQGGPPKEVFCLKYSGFRLIGYSVCQGKAIGIAEYSNSRPNYFQSHLTVVVDFTSICVSRYIEHLEFHTENLYQYCNKLYYRYINKANSNDTLIVLCFLLTFVFHP